MSPELTGIDEDITRIEDWNVSRLAQESAVVGKQPHPEIPEHQNGHN
jgi:hypothetical protein